MNTDRTSQMPTVDAEAFWMDGYAILRGVFTPEEVLAWREAAYQTSRDDWVQLRPDLLSRISMSGLSCIANCRVCLPSAASPQTS
jgi:hypothetical protein